MTVSIQWYQAFAQESSRIKGYDGSHLVFYSLGIAGESGEIVDKIKKGVRGDYDIENMTDEERRALALEIGDLMWYVTNLTNELGYELEDILKMNVDKLLDRRARGKSRGDGDNR